MSTRVNQPARVTADDLAPMCRQLGTLLINGIDLLRAVDTTREQIKAPALKDVLFRLKSDLEDGRLVADSLARYPGIFTPFFMSMVRQGEKEGALGDMFLTLADFLDRERGVAPAAPPAQQAGAIDIDLLVEKVRPFLFWQTMTLGVIALGIAVLLGAAHLDLIADGSLGGSIALWVAVCLLLSALIISRFRPPQLVPAPLPWPTRPAPEPLVGSDGSDSPDATFEAEEATVEAPPIGEVHPDVLAAMSSSDATLSRNGRAPVEPDPAAKRIEL